MNSHLACTNTDQRGTPPAFSRSCPSALFKGVTILNTTQEAGR